MSYQPAPGMDESGMHYGQGYPAAVTKPKSVDLAEKLMYGGAAVTVLSGLLSLFVDRDAMRDAVREQLEAAGTSVSTADIDSAMTMGLVLGLVMTVISAALWVLMGWLNGKGVGWARIVATILGVLGVLSTFASLFSAGLVPGSMPTSALSMVFSVVIGLIALGVVILLWRKESSDYFAAQARR